MIKQFLSFDKIKSQQRVSPSTNFCDIFQIICQYQLVYAIVKILPRILAPGKFDFHVNHFPAKSTWSFQFLTACGLTLINLKQIVSGTTSPIWQASSLVLFLCSWESQSYTRSTKNTRMFKLTRGK